MIPEPITLGGRSGTVVYLDLGWQPVPAARASLARVLYDDGGSSFFRVSAAPAETPAPLAAAGVRPAAGLAQWARGARAAARRPVGPSGRPAGLGAAGTPAASVSDNGDGNPSARAAGGPGSGNFGHAGRPGEVGGSGEGLGETRHTSSTMMQAEPLPVSLRAAEDRIRFEEHEHLFYTNPDGQVVGYFGSDLRSEVLINQGRVIPHQFQDGVITHNHPSGNGLSIQDGVTAAAKNVVEMRAVTKDGTFVIHREGPDWPPTFIDNLQAVEQEVFRDFSAKIKDHQLTIAQANSAHYREVYGRLEHRIGGFSHRFEPRA